MADPTAPAAVKFREFAAKFREHIKTHTKPGTVRFYGECLDRIMTHSPIADADLAAINGEQVGGYVQRRRNLAGNSVTTINGDLRTLRRMLRLAEEWGLISRAPRIHELTDAVGHTRVISHREEAAYLRLPPRHFAMRRSWRRTPGCGLIRVLPPAVGQRQSGANARGGKWAAPSSSRENLERGSCHPFDAASEGGVGYKVAILQWQTSSQIRVPRCREQGASRHVATSARTRDAASATGLIPVLLLAPHLRNEVRGKRYGSILTGSVDGTQFAEGDRALLHPRN